MRSKKSALSIETVIVIVICVVVLLLLTTGFGRTFTNFIRGINSCEAKGGTCIGSCGGTLEPILAGDAGCRKEFKGQNLVCCKDERRAEEELRGYGAHSDLIKVTLNGASTPLYYGERRDLEIGKTYYIEVFLSDEIRGRLDSGVKYCGIWMEDKGISEEYALKDLGQSKVKDYDKLQEAPLIKDIKRDTVGDVEGAIIRKCTRAGTTDKLILFPRMFTPEELSAGRTYTFRVIVYSGDVSQAIDQNQYRVDSVDARNELEDSDNWVAEFTALFRVTPIIEITGISGTWVASDDITVRANEPYKLSKVWAKIVGDFGSDDNLYQQLETACKTVTGYKKSIHKITALKVGKEGINVIFTLGHHAYQEAMYESQEQPITVTKNQAKIHLDASSIAETFNINDMKEEYEGELKERYLCVKADVVAPDGRKLTVTSYSEQPLRLDVAPPKIDNTNDYISVVYPDSRLLEGNLQNLLNQGRISPGQQVTPYYFNEYPKVIIKKCFDKSGCKNYDYYFAPTYIRVNIHADDLQTGIVSVIIGQGLNYLYNYLMTRNPLKTICPLANSGQYRYNTHPEIRSRRGEQGVFCIRVKDAVGNYWLTWKVVYNPYDVIEDVVQETVT